MLICMRIVLLGGNTGGCQTGTNTFNIGYIHDPPVADSAGVTLRYTGGDLCHKGKPNEAHRSTRIQFVCGPFEVS